MGAVRFLEDGVLLYQHSPSFLGSLSGSWQVCGRVPPEALLYQTVQGDKLQVKGHPIRLLMTGIDTSETLLQDQCVHAPLMQQRLVACWDTSPSNSEIMIEPKIYSF